MLRGWLSDVETTRKTTVITRRRLDDGGNSELMSRFVGHTTLQEENARDLLCLQSMRYGKNTCGEGCL